MRALAAAVLAVLSLLILTPQASLAGAENWPSVKGVKVLNGDTLPSLDLDAIETAAVLLFDRCPAMQVDLALVDAPRWYVETTNGGWGEDVLSPRGWDGAVVLEADGGDSMLLIGQGADGKPGGIELKGTPFLKGCAQDPDEPTVTLELDPTVRLWTQ